MGRMRGSVILVIIPLYGVTKCVTDKENLTVRVEGRVERIGFAR